MRDFVKKLDKVFNSSNFFRVTLLFFIFESLWIAISATYPQAFDENFHFGLIQVYSHYWLPFLNSQPPHANAFGAVARDPSYLYHYLMSFPYRIIATYVHGQIGQVVLLRIINVGLFTTGLVLFRRILIKVGTSSALANITILLFTLVPIVPQLAAQINYDNLFIPLTALIILLAFKLIGQLKHHSLSAPVLVYVITLCLLTSLVKYAFLPIFFGIIVFLLVVCLWKYKYSVKDVFIQLYKSWNKQTFLIKFLLLSMFVISMGMFIQRDVANLIKYKTVNPDCGVVLNYNDCNSYSVWSYNNTAHQMVNSEKSNGKLSYINPVSYSLEWVYWMWYRLFFAINGPNSNYTSFPNYPPLPLPSAAAVIVAISGIAIAVKWRKKIFRNNLYISLLLFVSLLYIGALFTEGYSVYHYTDILENMNGRYLLPVLLFLIAIIGRAFSFEFRNSVNTKMLVTILVLVLFLQGGGFLTFITRSDNTWYLQNNTIQKINNKARIITKPLLIKGSKSYGTKKWFFN